MPSVPLRVSVASWASTAWGRTLAARAATACPTAMLTVASIMTSAEAMTSSRSSGSAPHTVVTSMRSLMARSRVARASALSCPMSVST